MTQYVVVVTQDQPGEIDTETWVFGPFDDEEKAEEQAEDMNMRRVDCAAEVQILFTPS